MYSASNLCSLELLASRRPFWVSSGPVHRHEGAVLALAVVDHGQKVAGLMSDKSEERVVSEE